MAVQQEWTQGVQLGGCCSGPGRGDNDSNEWVAVGSLELGDYMGFAEGCCGLRMLPRYPSAISQEQEDGRER